MEKFIKKQLEIKTLWEEVNLLKQKWYTHLWHDCSKKESGFVVLFNSFFNFNIFYDISSYEDGDGCNSVYIAKCKWFRWDEKWFCMSSDIADDDNDSISFIKENNKVDSFLLRELPENDIDINDLRYWCKQEVVYLNKLLDQLVRAADIALMFHNNLNKEL